MGEQKAVNWLLKHNYKKIRNLSHPILILYFKNPIQIFLGLGLKAFEINAG
jgi:hypothetical protein